MNKINPRKRQQNNRHKRIYTIDYLEWRTSGYCRMWSSIGKLSMAELHVLIVLSLTYQSTQQSPQSPISHPLFRDIYIIRYSVTAGYIIQFEVVAVSFWFYFHCGSGSRIRISDPKFLISSFFGSDMEHNFHDPKIRIFDFRIGSDRIWYPKMHIPSRKFEFTHHVWRGYIGVRFTIHYDMSRDFPPYDSFNY